MESGSYTVIPLPPTQKDRIIDFNEKHLLDKYNYSTYAI